MAFDLDGPIAKADTRKGSRRRGEEVHAGSISPVRGAVRAVVVDKLVKAGEKAQALATSGAAFG
jgi:hypothetical protein